VCALAGVSRAGYYRHWAASAAAPEETGCATPFSAWRWPIRTTARRIAAQLRREGFAVNHKRVLRLMREEICCA